MLCTSNWSKSNWDGYQLYLMPEEPIYLVHMIKDGIGNYVSVDFKYMSDKSVCEKGSLDTAGLTSFGMSWPLVSTVSIPDGVGGIS